MIFDLHVHTSFSDGRDDVEAVLKAAARRGLDGISITDHNTLEGSIAAQRLIDEMELSLILIPGAEVTTSEGHLLVFGICELPPLRRSPEETIDTVHDMGGIAAVPHPYHLFRNAIGRVPPVDAVEVYNSRYITGVSNALARLQAKRKNLPMIAGSDSHFAETVGLGITCVDAKCTEDILSEIRAGRTKIDGKRTPSRFATGNAVSGVFNGVKQVIRQKI